MEVIPREQSNTTWTNQTDPLVNYLVVKPSKMSKIHGTKGKLRREDIELQLDEGRKRLLRLRFRELESKRIAERM